MAGYHLGHPDLDASLAVLLDVVRGSLIRSGMFPPFGIVWTPGREPAFVAANFYQVAGRGLVDRVGDGLRRAAAEPDTRAVGLVHDSRIDRPFRPERAGAFRVDLEHRDGPALTITVTWRKGWFNRVKLRVSETRPRLRKYFGPGTGES